MRIEMMENGLVSRARRAEVMDGIGDASRIMHGLASHAHVRLQLYRGWNLQVVSVPSGALALGKMIIKEQKCLVSSVLAFLSDMWSGIKLRDSR